MLLRGSSHLGEKDFSKFTILPPFWGRKPQHFASKMLNFAITRGSNEFIVITRGSNEFIVTKLFSAYACSTNHRYHINCIVWCHYQIMIMICINFTTMYTHQYFRVGHTIANPFSVMPSLPVLSQLSLNSIELSILFFKFQIEKIIKITFLELLFLFCA